MGCREFDILYVVDPGRYWYELGDESGASYYAGRLKQYTERYEHVIMIGDSMGATAALAFSEQATAVLAFCPQVGNSSFGPRTAPTLYIRDLILKLSDVNLIEKFML